METETMTLTDFLLARIAEDEEAAQASVQGPWFTVAPHGWDDAPDLVGRLVSTSSDWQDFGDYVTPAGGEHGDEGLNTDAARHIARHDPSRVLAECEAKRRIISLEASDRAKAGAPPYSGPLTRDDGEPGRHPNLVAYIAEHCEPVTNTAILRALALPYADHPNHRDEWRP